MKIEITVNGTCWTCSMGRILYSAPIHSCTAAQFTKAVRRAEHQRNSVGK